MVNDTENSQKINIRLRENISSRSDEGFKIRDTLRFLQIHSKSHSLKKHQESLLYYFSIVIVSYCYCSRLS